MFKVIGAITLTLVLSSAAQAQYDESYLKIGSVETTEVTDSDVLNSVNYSESKLLVTNPFVTTINGLKNEADAQCEQATAQGQNHLMSISNAELAQIVKIGKQVWTIIEKNKPVVNVETDSVTVLPIKADCWRWLTEWQAPVTRTYRTKYKNLYGITVVDFTYKLVFIPGGRYNGQGRYLARVTILPSNLRVLWGFKFNASVSVPSVLNYGTVVDPIAAAQIELKYSVDTVMAHDSATVGFLVKGTGEALAL